MTDSITGAIMVGTGTGIAFVIVVAIMMDSFGTHFPNTPSDFLRTASKVDETREFLSNYPKANSTVYLRDIVEYSSQDTVGRYAGLRISIDRNGGAPTFMQVNCVVIGNELDSIEIHGSKLEGTMLAGITTFLQDKRCPETAFAID